MSNFIEQKDSLVVVTGLPRSGTSLVMSLLAAGGQPILTDAIRAADASNPCGYFEYEPVKALMRESRWLGQHMGKAVKIISPLLPFIPKEIPLKVIHVRRDIGEVLASQSAMLDRNGKAPVEYQELLKPAFQKQIAATKLLLASRSNTEMLELEFGNVVQSPVEAIDRLMEFLPTLLNRAAMLAAVRPELHRQKSGA